MPLFRSKAARELDAIIAELQANLENNYKDTAHAAREKLGRRLEELRSEGKISEKLYKKYFVIYHEYSVKMTGYRH
ncbi:MAG: hypothetical protein IJC71_03880 [Clostridia bacterium]|nr:hypothetical protein [Clostridia bacterium]